MMAEPGVEVTELPSGLRVVTEHLPAARSVAIGAWVGVGNRDEPPEGLGVSHFLEHLLFKGTEQRSARQIAEQVDAAGGEMNAYTTKEYTAYYLRVPEAHLWESLGVLCDVVGAPALRPGDVDAEREVILEELYLQADEPDDLVHTDLYEALFPGHPLGWEILGSADTVAAMTPAAIEAFHRSWYRPRNLVVAVAGPVRHDQVVHEAAEGLEDTARGVAPKRSAPRVAPEGLRTRERAGEIVHLALGWRAPGVGDPDRFALAVTNQLVGGGISSRLFQSVREERGLAYSVFSALSTYSDSGVFSVYAGTTPSKVNELVAVVREQLASLVRDGVGDGELERARGAVRGATELYLEDTGHRMDRLATSLTLRGAVMPIDEYLDAIASVDAVDVRRIAARVLGAEPTITAVGPAAAAGLGR